MYLDVLRQQKIEIVASTVAISMRMHAVKHLAFLDIFHVSACRLSFYFEDILICS